MRTEQKYSVQQPLLWSHRTNEDRFLIDLCSASLTDTSLAITLTSVLFPVQSYRTVLPIPLNTLVDLHWYSRCISTLTPSVTCSEAAHAMVVNIWAGYLH